MTVGKVVLALRTCPLFFESGSSDQLCSFSYGHPLVANSRPYMSQSTTSTSPEILNRTLIISSIPTAILT
ncbi:hypothetical protein Y032_0236g3224 [Ancylostoma ceylanicum]|uniref:Uncharacterized protein n=1 Tax=Ancylostoma ceylanicum TaxID=53326 RepID=A0A016SEK0_9BILA|nr:hypothetical protein Y032_0236g3224 [Ancylostoma ceylanicum]